MSEFLKPNLDISNAQIHEKALAADVIVFQRPSSKNSLELAKLLRKKGKKIIMDNDDTYEGIPLHRLGNEKQREIAKELGANLREFLAFADGATTSTLTLVDEYKKINPNVALLKNCIDPLDEFPTKPNTTGKFRVGLIGSVTSNDDYIHIKDQLKRLDDRGDITLVILGVKFKDGTIMPSMLEDYEFWSSLKNVEWHPVVHVTEYMSTVASLALDLAIIPRKEHYFNQCKSNVKYLEMSLLKIPVLAQGFSDGSSPYQQGCAYLTIVNDNSTWYDEVVNVKEKHSTYKLLAEQAHDFVLEFYNIATYASEWTKAITALCESPRKS